MTDECHSGALRCGIRGAATMQKSHVHTAEGSEIKVQVITPFYHRHH